MTTTVRIPGKVRTSDELLHHKAAPGGGVEFEGWASTNRKDRMGEIIDETAWQGTLDEYRASGVLLFNHSADKPVGVATAVDIVPGKGLYLKGRIPGGWEASDAAAAMVRSGAVKTLSVGFRENSPGVVDQSGIYHIVDAALYEVSLAPVAANIDCTFVMTSDGKLCAVELADVARPRRPIRQALQRLQNQAEILRLKLALRDLTRQVGGRVRRKGVLPYASHPIQDPGTPWSASKARASLRAWAESAGGDLDFTKYAQGFSFVVPGQEHLLGSYKLPHHVYSGRLLTNLRGCRAVLAVLAGARGGLNLSEAEKRGVYDHIAKHLTDDFHTTVPAFADLGKMMEHVTAQDLVGAEV